VKFLELVDYGPAKSWSHFGSEPERVVDVVLVVGLL